VTTSQIAALAAVLLAGPVATPAPAQPVNAPIPAATAPTYAGAPGHDPNEVICKTRGEPGHLGSHRLCGTRAQWEQLARDGADALAKVQNASRFNANPMNNGMGTGMGGH
jgi:hypothetical protein